MLNQNQKDQLLKPLNPSRVATRSQAGRSLSYLETWDVKAHLIRIFGFGGWSWDVKTAELAFEEKNEKGQWNVGYKVIGTLTINHWASYTEAAVGSATLPQRGEAHDMAVKTGESDALKRSAINLGTQFGLSLYNNGSQKDVVGMTLDGDDTPTAPPMDEPAPIVVPDDNDGSAAWIEQMTSAVRDKDVPALLEMQKDMKEQGVQDWLYQGQTLAKWLDRAIAKVGQ
jgi:hypothetical protein